ncbi:hypothetical protein EVAR_16647_1 [Eumeta japonica]|uniref:Uncharacterized protein n=1 Tax=Eumeta variegata TaxID=151549 RepID=A0A4C1V0V8_EUMVA|nr:hypothetical protein EVAR_16647_1 [Eumeta japonica]
MEGRTRLRQYERENVKELLQAARNQPTLKTQEILEGKQSPKSSRNHEEQIKLGIMKAVDELYQLSLALSRAPAGSRFEFAGEPLRSRRESSGGGRIGPCKSFGAWKRTSPNGVTAATCAGSRSRPPPTARN